MLENTFTYIRRKIRCLQVKKKEQNRPTVYKVHYKPLFVFANLDQLIIMDAHSFNIATNLNVVQVGKYTLVFSNQVSLTELSCSNSDI